MDTVDEIKDAILKLPEDDIWTVHDWLTVYCSDLWDKQIERDMKAGKWDNMAREAHEDYDAGRTTELTPKSTPSSERKEKMNSLEELEAIVKRLPEHDLDAFRRWFFEYDAKVWDKEFEEDVRLGRLDEFGKRAKQAIREGRYREI